MSETSPRDPGLQPERTGLSWSRTAFLMLLVSAILLRGGIVHHERWLALAGVGLLAGTGAMYAWAGLRLRFIMTSRAPVNAPSAWAMRLTALVIGLAGLTVAASVLYHGELISRLSTLLP